jgi:hypothetical protein
MFDNVCLIFENDSEVFLSKHFKEQMVRNTTVGQHKKMAVCLCPTCMTHMPKNMLLFARHNNDDNDSNNDNNGDKDNIDNNDNSNDANMLNLSVAPAVPPLFIQPSSAGASFVPPIPLAELACGHWMPRPHDCCCMLGDHHCSTHAKHRHRKHSGVQVLGKPPHDVTCPVRRHLQRQ